jgi:hypothetical protein
LIQAAIIALFRVINRYVGNPMMARTAMMRALHQRERMKRRSRAGNAPKPTGSFDDRYQEESGSPILGQRGPFLTRSRHP